jgi:hypothetical protein
MLAALVVIVDKLVSISGVFISIQITSNASFLRENTALHTGRIHIITPVEPSPSLSLSKNICTCKYIGKYFAEMKAVTLKY